MGKLDGKVAIVTGAARGIGFAQARMLAGEGAAVVLTDVSPDGQRQAGSISGKTMFVEHDVSDWESWERVVRTTEKAFGGVHILVNTAGIVRGGAIEDTTAEIFKKVFEVNTLGVFLGTKAVVEPMTRAGGGAIVNVCSSSAFRGEARTSAYSASKWAVRGLTKTTAKELASRRIRVNALFPGPTDTDLLRELGVDPDHVAAMITPVEFAASPDDIASATLYLVSDEARYVYGAELAVDGGHSI